MQKAIKTIREEQIRMDQENLGLRADCKRLKARLEESDKEREFY